MCFRPILVETQSEAIVVAMSLVYIITHLPVNCREVTKGFDTLTGMEGVETKKEGIFVMPKERITILSTYVYSSTGVSNDREAASDCQRQLSELQERFDAQSHRVENFRAAKLP